MQLAADRSDFLDQVLLDVHVDILVRDGIFQLTVADSFKYGLQSFLNLCRILLRNDPALGQHRHMRQASLHILLGQRLVESDRCGIFFN
ncbi:hypothetical protein D3C79_1026320 [compost metagenome]